VRRPQDDGGNALVEFTYLGVLLIVPLIYLLVTVFSVQSAAFGVTEAARQAGRAYVQADTAEQAAARAAAAAELAMGDQGLALRPGALRVVAPQGCSPAAPSPWWCGTT
jgi:Flp pilus assembly protein TadG